RRAVAAQPAETALRPGQSRRSRRNQGRVHRARPAPRRASGRCHGCDRIIGLPDGGASISDWIKALSVIGNDLEAPAIRIEPRIGAVLSALGEAEGVQLARMSGSGATCFALFASRAEAQAAAGKLLREHPAWWIHAGELS